MNDAKKIPVGLQLFSVRDEIADDVPATLKAIAEIGYAGAEPWGYNGEQLEWQGWKPNDLRKLYDDNGLQCCGMHLRTEALMGDNLQRTIELNQALGNRFLIIAADKGRMSAVDSIMELAEILNGVADKLKPLNMLTGYHAHPFDFEIIDGQTAWERLFDNTRDDVVMQIDIANTANGDGDPVAMLRKYPGRAKSVHLREHGEGDVVIGEGDADWDTIFELCETQHHPEWYVVEEGPGKGFDVPRRSFEALKKFGKV